MGHKEKTEAGNPAKITKMQIARSRSKDRPECRKSKEKDG